MNTDAPNDISFGAEVDAPAAPKTM